MEIGLANSNRMTNITNAGNLSPVRARSGRSGVRLDIIQTYRHDMTTDIYLLSGNLQQY